MYRWAYVDRRTVWPNGRWATRRGAWFLGAASSVRTERARIGLRVMDDADNDEGVSRPAESRDTRSTLAVGTVVGGRYVILRSLEAHATADLYAAHDPELDRAIAIEVLRRPEPKVDNVTRGLSQLSHPNVVVVHDVGVHEGCTYVAMEQVEGATLREWAAVPRPWPRVLEVVIAAAEGVAAMHAAGFVHGDIRLESILLGNDGRVRVMRPRLSLGTANAAGGGAGGPADDQSALCRLAWALLGGTLGTTRAARSAARTAVTPTGRVTGPRWLADALRIGLAPIPSQRHASIRSLLRTLSRARSHQRRRRVAQAGAACLVIGVGIETYRADARHRSALTCERSGDAMDSVWNAARRSEFSAAVLGVGLPYARDAAEKTITQIDRYAEAWRRARIDICLAHDVEARWDSATVERAAWCMEERKDHVSLLVDVVIDAPRAGVDSMVVSAAKLPLIDACLDTERVVSAPLPSPRDGEAARAVRADLIHASLLEAIGDFARAQEVATSALDRARSIAWPPLTSAAHRSVASVQDALGDYSSAEAGFEAAFLVGLASWSGREAAVDAAISLAYTHGNRLARPTDARRWVRMAEVLMSSLPTDPLRQAALWNVVGATSSGTGDHQAAAHAYEAALGLWTDALGPQHPYVAFGLNNLGVVAEATGDATLAADLYGRALAARESALGPEHPTTALSMHNLAIARLSLGDVDSARELAARALRVREAALGAGHPHVAATLAVLATAAAAAGDHRNAITSLRRVVKIDTIALGPEHPDVGNDHTNLATTLYEGGESAEAIVEAHRAIQVLESHFGASDPNLVQALVVVGASQLRLGRSAEARPAFQRALDILEAAPGQPEELRLDPLGGLSECALLDGRVPEARAMAKQAVALADRPPTTQLITPTAWAKAGATARFVHARALWAAPSDAMERNEARRLAERTLLDLRASEADPHLLAEVEAWLSQTGSVTR